MKSAFHRRAFWSIAGLFLLGLAGWEATQVTRGGRKAFAGALLPPPFRSRSGERPLAVREIQTGDPVANYLTRAKRGMTEQEVRWMLEDFEAAGLGRDEDEFDFPKAQAYRKKLEEWYLAALSEGLSLTPGQKQEMKAGMDVRFGNDLQRLEELKSSSGERGERRPGYIFLGGSDLWDAYEQFYRFSVRLFNDSAFAPWNVTQLSEDQTALTVRYWLIAEWKRLSEESPFGPFNSEPWSWLYVKAEYDPFAEPERKTLIQDPTTGNLLENAGPVIYREHAVQSGVFAFTPEQVPSWNEATSLLTQARCCHPAQLRMALLEDPNLFQRMRAELDGAAVQMSHSAISQ